MKKIVFILFIFCLFCNSCKVSYKFNDISIPPEAKSASVAVFENNASLASPLESQKFTNQLRDMIAQQTPLNLIQANADLQFEGAISDYNITPVAIQTGDQAALNRLTISINVKYTCKFDSKKNFEKTFTRFADYNSSTNISSVENDLMDNINKQISQDVFNLAFNNW